jgi:bacterioferritin (cytochrome b1)
MTELNTLEHANQERILDALNRAFSERHSSLAQYILDAQPYITPNDEGTLECIRAIAEFDRIEADRIADAIDSLGGIPQISTHEAVTAELNYLALGYLRKVLIEELHKQLDAYKTDIPLMQDNPIAREALTNLEQGLRALLVNLESIH